MTGSIRNFEKLNFTPKSSVFCFSQGQTSKYDRLAQFNSWKLSRMLCSYSHFDESDFQFVHEKLISPTMTRFCMPCLRCVAFIKFSN